MVYLQPVESEIAYPVAFRDEEDRREFLKSKCIVYFDESAGYTEIELRGDPVASEKLAKVLVFPASSQLEELRGIRYEIQELRNYLGSITNSQILAQLAYHVSKLTQRISELENSSGSQRKNSSRSRAKKVPSEQPVKKVRYEDLPPGIRRKVDILVEKGAAYCSQYRLYPTRVFMKYVREGRLPEILLNVPDDLIVLVKLLARRPAGVTFAELSSLLQK